MLHHNGIYNRRQTNLPTQRTVLYLSLFFNVMLAIIVGFFMTTKSLQQTSHGIEQKWHGGHPATERQGSCWCGAEDHYCMCTPNMAIDLIIVAGKEGQEHLWLVRRKDTNQLATMGGFVDVNESVEATVRRELKEEMDIYLGTIQPVLFGVYSDPRRDNRRRNVSAVFVVHLEDDSIRPHAGDDAKEVKRISIDEIEEHSYFADHKTILLDYRRFIRGEDIQYHSEGDFANDIIRSTCAKHQDLFFPKKA